MRSHDLRPGSFDASPRRFDPPISIVWLTAATLMVSVVSATAAVVPVPVSPGAAHESALTEARCPTFSWAGIEGASGYEVAVFRLGGAPDEEPALVTRAMLPRSATTWTPPVGQCLERGERYAWSIAARDVGGGLEAPGESPLDWAPAFLFEVEAAPSVEELERAVATIERHLARRGDAGAAHSGEAPGVARRLATSRPPAQTATEGVRIASAASAPALGDASLKVSSQIHLAAASDLFKDGVVFLWDDAEGNTALGREALSSVAGTATNNTAFGRGALRDTGGGPSPLQGSFNTAIGDQAMQANSTGNSNTATGSGALMSSTVGTSNTATGRDALRANVDGNRNSAHGAWALSSNVDGYWNTASGVNALLSNTTGSENTATGFGALIGNVSGGENTAHGVYSLRYTTGSRNVALGHHAGRYNVSGEDSIFIGNRGLASDDETIKIGVQGLQTSAYLAGIWERKVDQDEQMAVLIDATGKLGTVLSTRRVKQDIEDLGPLVARLLELRPVAFRYREDAAASPDGPRQFGLIAEEVAEVFPELVVYDREGKPRTVKYHLLGSLLLGELQRQHELLEELYRRLGERPEAIESRSPRGKSRRGGR